MFITHEINKYTRFVDQYKYNVSYIPALYLPRCFQLHF